MPVSTKSDPARFRSLVNVRVTSAITDIAVTRMQPGMAMVRSPARNSLLSESLPETNGVPKWSAASRQRLARRGRARPAGRACRVWPQREVVEDRGPVRVAADGDDVAQRLVDGGLGHRRTGRASP